MSLPYNSRRQQTDCGHRARRPARRAKARPPGSLASSGGGSPGHSKDTRARAVKGAGLTGGGTGGRDGVQEASGGRGCGTATKGSGEHDGDRSALAGAEREAGVSSRAAQQFVGAGLTHRRTLGGAEGPPPAELAPAEAGGGCREVSGRYGGALRTNHAGALRRFLSHSERLGVGGKAGRARDSVDFKSTTEEIPNAMIPALCRRRIRVPDPLLQPVSPKKILFWYWAIWRGYSGQ